MLHKAVLHAHERTIIEQRVRINSRWMPTCYICIATLLVNQGSIKQGIPCLLCALPLALSLLFSVFPAGSAKISEAKMVADIWQIFFFTCFSFISGVGRNMFFSSTQSSHLADQFRKWSFQNSDINFANSNEIDLLDIPSKNTQFRLSEILALWISKSATKRWSNRQVILNIIRPLNAAFFEIVDVDLCIKQLAVLHTVPKHSLAYLEFLLWRIAQFLTRILLFTGSSFTFFWCRIFSRIIHPFWCSIIRRLVIDIALAFSFCHFARPNDSEDSDLWLDSNEIDFISRSGCIERPVMT